MTIAANIKRLIDSYLDINPDLLFGDQELPVLPDIIKAPVNIGQIVYTQKGVFKRALDVQPFQVTNIIVSQNQKGVWTKRFSVCWAPNGEIMVNYKYTFDFDDLGKTVFYSKKTAEMVWSQIINNKKKETFYD